MKKTIRAGMGVRSKLLILGVILFAMGFSGVYFYQHSRVKIGEHYLRLNPRATIDSDKEYHLVLWDYLLPTASGKKEYGEYLQRALAEFQKIYPNIKVKYEWLDPLEGAARLRQALVENKAPDVYCSYFDLPEFYYARQIPVGPFLNKEEMEQYNLKLRQLYSVGKVLCSFPHWISADIWLGNRTLLEQAGVNPEKIQANGWTWHDLGQLAVGMPEQQLLLVGNPLRSEHLEYLKAMSVDEQQLAEQLEELRKLGGTKKIPADYDRNIIERFLSGRTLLLAGVRPTVYSNLQQRRHKAKSVEDSEIVLLPAPHFSGVGELQLIKPGIINIYRNRSTKGDDHVAAAVKLGQFLSLYQNNVPWAQWGLYVDGNGAEATTNDERFFAELLQRSKLKCVTGSGDHELVRQIFSGKISRQQLWEYFNLKL